MTSYLEIIDFIFSELRHYMILIKTKQEKIYWRHYEQIQKEDHRSHDERDLNIIRQCSLSGKQIGHEEVLRDRDVFVLLYVVISFRLYMR